MACNSAAHSFIDPDATASQRWHGGGIRFRNIDGAVLDPVLAVRNTGGELSRVSGRIHYTLPDGDTASITLPQKPILPGMSRVFSLADLIDQVNLPASVQYGGIEIEYDTPAGSIIPSVQSVSQNGKHVFQVPMFDPQNMPASAGGFPWKADGDFRTVLYIQNVSDVERRFTAHLGFEGGQYSIGDRTIRPQETIAVDFREFRDQQTADKLGSLIPLDIDHGQIAWSARGGGPKTLTVRSEQISLSDGISSTYACYNGCCENRVIDGWIDPVSFQDVIGGSLFMSGTQIEETCYLDQFYTPIAFITWSSEDTDVATIDTDGFAEAVGVGETTIFGFWQREWYYFGLGTVCEPIYIDRNDPVPTVVAQEIVLNNVNTDVNAANAPFSTGIGIPTATVILEAPSYPVCYQGRQSFHILVHFQMPPNTHVMSTDPGYTYVSESGTLWQYQSHEFTNLNYTSRTGTLKIKMRQNNLDEDEAKDWIRIRIGATLNNGVRVSGVGKVIFRCP